MQKITIAIVILALSGCASKVDRHETYDLINAEMTKAAQPQGKSVRAAQPDAVSASLLPPLNIEVPKARKPLEERFGLSLNNVPAAQFFMAIVSGTRYSMLVPPDLTGTISANLKDVTVFEALDAIREMYGYDYKVDGSRIYIKPLTLQTRIFQVNYLTGSRKGTSDIRVTSGSVSDASSAGTMQGATSSTTSGSKSISLDSSKITTTSDTDFWTDLKDSLEAIVGGTKDGRSIVISPQSGVVVVRGMWNDLQNVAAYLKASQLSVDRQVILEAKILEVQLNDSFQAGVNWASFGSILGINNNRAAAGFLAPGTNLASAASSNNLKTTVGATNPTTGAIGTTTFNATTSLAVDTASAAGSIFGLALQTNNFAALLTLLETQGKVHVLSSPRIATLNNQKAILKVGTDDFFVTNVTTTSTSSGAGTTTSPSLTLQPFFSGVALDVTPQIDDAGNIILHVHPSVSNVTSVKQVIDLGSGGTFSLPLASSAVSETDSVVRGQDGQIVAIGGLMRQAMVSDRSQLPGVGDVPVVGSLFRNTNQVMQKRELVILLKPTIVQGDASWTRDILESEQRMKTLGGGSTSER
jgi:MSHA biogenesis protein MshL